MPYSDSVRSLRGTTELNVGAPHALEYADHELAVPDRGDRKIWPGGGVKSFGPPLRGPARTTSKGRPKRRPFSSRVAARSAADRVVGAEDRL